MTEADVRIAVMCIDERVRSLQVVAEEIRADGGPLAHQYAHDCEVEAWRCYQAAERLLSRGGRGRTREKMAVAA